MKKVHKKAQVYGLSAFIYALAIAVILLIGLIGMSKDFETKSKAATYRQYTSNIVIQAEGAKKIMEQERAHALDKSLFLTGAYGGISPFTVSLTDCPVRLTHSISTIPEQVINYWRDGDTLCIPVEDDVVNNIEETAKEIFSKPAPQLASAINAITGKEYDMDYIMKVRNHTNEYFEISWFPTGTVTSDGETTTLKEITLNYPPGENIIEYSFDPFVFSKSETPFFRIKSDSEEFTINQRLNDRLNYSQIITSESGDDVIIGKVEQGDICVKPDKITKCGDFCVNGIDDVNCDDTTVGDVDCADVGCKTTCWGASGKQEDTTKPWTNGCESKYADTCVGDTNSLSDKPDYDDIEKDDCTGDVGTWKEKTEYDCTTDPYLSDYCTQDPNNILNSFKSLIENAQNHPNTPNACDFDLSSFTNNYGEYDGTCTAYSKRNENDELIVTGFSGTCNTNTYYNNLMKCVMKRQINNIQSSINTLTFPDLDCKDAHLLDVIDCDIKHDSDPELRDCVLHANAIQLECIREKSDFKVEFNTFNLTFTSDRANILFYNDTA